MHPCRSHSVGLEGGRGPRTGGNSDWVPLSTSWAGGERGESIPLKEGLYSKGKIFVRPGPLTIDKGGFGGDWRRALATYFQDLGNFGQGRGSN